MKTVLNLCAVKISAMNSESGDFFTFLQSIFSTPNLGTVASEAKCKRFCNFYRALPDISTKAAFLSYLAQSHGINQDNVIQGAQTLAVSQERGEAFVLKAMERLRASMTPSYQSLLQQIGRIEGGVKFLVDLRSDILNCITSSTSELDSAHFQALNRLLQELLTLWFAVGFLELQRVTWTSPCDIVQKISDYEAVHPIRNWTDLKHRVGSYRRCYVFTHHSMPREPIVVLHTALTSEISSSIHSIIHNPRFRASSSDSPLTEAAPPHEPLEEENTSEITTAVFYSITSTQRGLKGVELGNYLIKRVVHELQTEFPHIASFSSLSPIPGFRDWLMNQINLQMHRARIGEEDSDQMLLTSAEMQTLENCRQNHHSSILEAFKHLVQSNQWLPRQEAVMAMKVPLLRLCARYLYLEKRRGFALNPVANFHLANGAVLWRINFLADTSIRGLNQSCGLMVNYRYYLDIAETNSQEYLLHQRISASNDVLDLIGSDTTTFKTVATPARQNSASSSPFRESGSE
ncbi:hypothetical protein C0Q70_11518 [Pomacea canaliculata]|uniref:Malonyl-CoA decarboxylase C-terminal domain-containing protein n=2 Tax=Pomacea canaliculata TaxID=400727 RepID=A0A2T7P699_POMCA|nr:malonyl-CoA decarboxylase, mitochondrial-like isoform X2 [Pomacea canaliculata]PVD28923.1 hypothetical protein C0Q70_11518 [Pomacea canaliculata]